MARLEAFKPLRVQRLGLLYDPNSLRAIPVEDGLREGRLLGAHQDPFDRMIAGQALAEDIPVISADAKLDGFGVRRIW